MAGFIGVLALLAGSLGLPYSGGYLASATCRPNWAWPASAARGVALVATIAVLVAAVLPRRWPPRCCPGSHWAQLYRS